MFFLGSCCNYNPTACCNYLQTACLPDPITSGIYTCQKVDTFKPRLAPQSYGFPKSYETSYGSSPIYSPEPNYGVGATYGASQNYPTGPSYGIEPVYPIQPEHQSYPVQRGAQRECKNPDGSPSVNPYQCSYPMDGGVRRELNAERTYEQLVRDLLHRSVQPTIPYKYDPLNHGLGPIGRK